MFADAGPFAVTAMALTAAAALGGVACRLVLLRHRRSDAPVWKLHADPQRFEYELYTPAGQRWVHRAIRLAAAAVLGFWLTVVCMVAGW